MDPRLWIGTGFAAVLVLFLMIAYFNSSKLEQGQWAILRFLCALCAGAAGGFLTGEAVFKLTGKLEAGEVAISGTAGVALFFAVWFTFGNLIQKPPEAVTFQVGANWTFEQTAKGLGAQDKAAVQLVGFTPEEMTAQIRQQELKAKTIKVALETLGQLAERPVRSYSVSLVESTYTLKTL